MNKTPQQIRNEVEKKIKELKKDMPYCKISLNNWEVLEAKLSILTEYDKSIKEMIEDLEKQADSFDLMDFTNPRDISILRQGTKIGFKRLKELLSKIGDNSEVEK
jgi:hypothetical protein